MFANWFSKLGEWHKRAKAKAKQVLGYVDELGAALEQFADRGTAFLADIAKYGSQIESWIAAVNDSAVPGSAKLASVWASISSELPQLLKYGQTLITWINAAVAAKKALGLLR